MEQDLSIAHRMLPRLLASPESDLLEIPALALAEADPVKVCYAPFDHVATNARLVVVGITPGRSQAEAALRAARIALSRGMSIPEALAGAKQTASFSGRTTRSNLVAMLDAIGVARHFGISSTSELFRPGAGDVHFTSALRYPVFVRGQNYNGTPNMLTTPLLRQMIDIHLAEEARLLSGALWLPLGPKAKIALDYLLKQGKLQKERVLFGLPHPSGANAERIAVFLGRKRPEDASNRTRPDALLAASARLSKQLSALNGAAA